jgi:DNA replication ATP-dependent helicase Dna2
MKAATYSNYVHQQLERIRDNEELDSVGKIKALRALLLKLFELATEADRLHFSTVYARIAYVAHRHGFAGQLIYQLHRFRREPLGQQSNAPLTDLLNTGFKVALAANQSIFKQSPPPAWVSRMDEPYPIDYREPDVVAFHQALRVVALEIDEENQFLIVREEERPTDIWRISFGKEQSNEHIGAAVSIIRKVAKVPVILNLLQAEAHQQRILSPRQIIIDPDHLIDVTAVASAFGAKDTPQPWAGLSRKLLPYEQRLPLLKGNVVNMFLDVLVNEPDTPFKELTRLIFQTQPLALCCLSDEEVKRLIHELRLHYSVLRQMAKNGLAERSIDRENSQLEPSFYSPTFGLQGRLDLLHRGQDDEGKDQTSIIELKSGKIFMPNKHGLNQSHFVQTLLYDLMINQAYGKSANVAAFILYSQADQQPLRYAPPERFTQLEALAVRNQILAIDLLVAQIGSNPNDDILAKTDTLIRKLRPANFKRLASFTERDFIRVLAAYELLTDLEKRYFGAFFGFIAREHRLAKTGEQGSEKLNGLASLWLDEPADKEATFELLGGLQLNNYDAKTGTITFNRPQREDQMVKFRTGDIVVLYATESEVPQKGEVLNSQIYKSTIISLGPERLGLRLRSRQLSDRVFRNKGGWTIEKDVLDSSFSNHYRGLWAWVESNQEKRQLLLGLKAPEKGPAPTPLPPTGTLTEEQRRIIGKLLAAPDYFLLWGPPGTGKTSMMLHYTLAHLLASSQENILIVAYTNRAVDEICESIERIGDGFRDYLRIGSRYGTAAAYQDRLLSIRSEHFTSRAELIEMLTTTRVFVGTVASVGGKEELFKLKGFDRIIVDEASQILEPLLLGLLCRTPKALLIGDHRQLPSVVQQKAAESKVYDAELHEAGIKDLSVSLFERLFLKAREEGWDWCYDQLRFQGRMHLDIMAFPAQTFYEQTLEILPEGIPHRQHQLTPLALGAATKLTFEQLSRQRVCYFPTEIDYTSTDRKTNRHEARQVVEIIHELQHLYATSPQPLASGDIGIITPYRAQIANLRRQLIQAALNPDDFTVDTVERYQGGARRIIIISFCTNDNLQMAALAQTNAEGIDRKLNVAMTRAREQLILIGCPEILNSVPHYAQLLNFIQMMEQEA